MAEKSKYDEHCLSPETVSAEAADSAVKKVFAILGVKVPDIK